MNPEIVKGQIRSVLIAVGGLVAGWFAARGWVSEQQVTAVLSSPVFAAVITMASGFIWSAVTHTEHNAVAVVTKIAEDPASPVRGVIMEPTVEGMKIAHAISGPVVSAGTSSARDLAAH